MTDILDLGVNSTDRVSTHDVVGKDATREFVLVPEDELTRQDWKELARALCEIADFDETGYGTGPAGGTRMLREVAAAKGWVTPEKHVLIALDTVNRPGITGKASLDANLNLYSSLPVTLPSVVNGNRRVAANQRAITYFASIDKPALVILETLLPSDSGLDTGFGESPDRTLNQDDDTIIEIPPTSAAGQTVSSETEKKKEVGPPGIGPRATPVVVSSPSLSTESSPNKQIELLNRTKKAETHRAHDLTAEVEQLMAENAVMTSKVEQLGLKNKQLTEEREKLVEEEKRLRGDLRRIENLEAQRERRVGSYSSTQEVLSEIRTPEPTAPPNYGSCLRRGGPTRMPLPLTRSPAPSSPLTSIPEHAEYDETTPRLPPKIRGRVLNRAQSMVLRSREPSEEYDQPTFFVGDNVVQPTAGEPRSSQHCEEANDVSDETRVACVSAKSPKSDGRPRLFEPKHFGLLKWKPEQSDISTHLDVVAQCIQEARALGATESNLIRLLMRTLPDEYFFLSQFISKEKQAKYEDFALEVAKTLSNKPQEQISSFFACTRKKGEYLLSYFYRLLTLYKSSNCLKGDDWMKDCTHVMNILHKINESLYADIKHELGRRLEKDLENGSLTIDSLKVHVAEIAKMGACKRHIATEAPKITAVSAAPETDERGRSFRSENAHEKGGSKFTQYRDTSDHKNDQKPKGVCWYCNKEGHFRAECREYKNALQRENGSSQRGRPFRGNQPWRRPFQQNKGQFNPWFGQDRTNGARGSGNRPFGQKRYNNRPQYNAPRAESSQSREQ